ncbi:hypothetical protein K438DRAFT_2012557 [Mycena galopus ATCC 62051]|nr:hypothetical protein K438DRAFT_2012557 [Mycena galopus ATCC 62051]
MTLLPDALLPKALDALPLPIRAVAKAACTSLSKSDVQQIVHIIDTTTKADLSQFLPVLFAFLDPNRIPAFTESIDDLLSSDPSVIEAIMAAKDALGRIPRIEIPPVAQPALWSRAFAWMQFFRAFESRPTSQIKDRSLLLWARFFIFSARIGPESAAHMIATPGFFVVVAHGWKLLLGFKNPEWQALGVESLAAFLTDKGKGIRYREEMIEGAGGTLDALATLVIRTISLFAPSRDNPIVSPESQDTLHRILFFVQTFESDILGAFNAQEEVRCKLPPLAAALASQDFVGCLTIALGALVRTMNTDSDLVVDAILPMLAAIFVSPGGYRKIPDAARNGFFHALIESGQRRRPDRFFKEILSKILGPFTVYYPVLGPISESFREVEGLASSEHFRCSTIFAEWSTFTEIVSHRLKVKQRFDARTAVSQRGCDNAECCKIGVKMRFKRCSGCKALRYCSENCQLADWDLMHRFSCRVYRRLYELCDESLMSNERAFLRFLLHHDYLEAKRKITLDKVPIFINEEGTSFTLFDYRDGRVKIQTLVLSVASEKVHLSSSVWWALWEDRVLRAKTSDGRIELHVMILPDGGGGGAYWVVPLRTSDCLIRDSLNQLKDSFVRDGTPGLIAAVDSLKVPEGVVEIH